jgi:hypothetical protein
MIAEVPSVTFLRHLQSEHFRTTVLPIAHVNLLFEFGDSVQPVNCPTFRRALLLNTGRATIPHPNPGNEPAEQGTSVRVALKRELWSLECAKGKRCVICHSCWPRL